MKVSIITVCYNSAATIRDTIESVLAQNYANIEYIIIDGASTDNTLDIVNEYIDHIGKVVSEPDKGIYDAMNKGINLATGDLIGILNSDDMYESTDSISHIVSKFYSLGKPDIIFGDLVIVSNTNIQHIKRFYSLPKFSPWMFRFGFMPPHPATLIKNEIYQKYGLYQTDFKIAADYELLVRFLWLKKINFAYINSVLVRMRAGGTSTSGLKSTFILNQEIIKACLLNGLYTNVFFLLVKIPFKLIELVRRPS